MFSLSCLIIHTKHTCIQCLHIVLHCMFVSSRCHIILDSFFFKFVYKLYKCLLLYWIQIISKTSLKSQILFCFSFGWKTYKDNANKKTATKIQLSLRFKKIGWPWSYFDFTNFLAKNILKLQSSNIWIFILHQIILLLLKI